MFKILFPNLILFQNSNHTARFTYEKKIPGPEYRKIIDDTYKTCEAYYGCLSTNEYGSTYLDPKKCKANNFDPIKATREQAERIYSIDTIFEKIEKERGHEAAMEELHAVGPYSIELSKQFAERVKPNLFVSCFSRLNGMNTIEKQACCSFDKVIKLIGCKINFYDKYVKVLAVKATEEGIFLDVEENLEGELIRYEINYKDDMVPCE